MIALDLSFLPKDTTFWLVVAGCLAVIIILAIIFRRNVSVGPFKLDAGAPKPAQNISVGKGMEADGLRVGGDVIGIKQPTGGNEAADVSVLDSAKLKNTTIAGDISAIRHQDDPRKNK